MNRRVPVRNLTYILPGVDRRIFVGLGVPDRPGPIATYAELGRTIPREGATHGVFDAHDGGRARRIVAFDQVIADDGTPLGHRFRPYGSLAAGDQFRSPREDEGWVKVVCPPGTCRHDVRDEFSCHVRAVGGYGNEWFVVADPDLGPHGDLVEVSS